MKKMQSLEAKLERSSGNSGFAQRIERAADWLYSVINDYENEENINIVSHLADADGFGAQIVWHKGIEALLRNRGNTLKKVQSERIMSFSSNEDNDEHISKVKERMGEGQYIISDLPTLRPVDANKFLSGGWIFDHHPVKRGFDEKFNIVNPHMHGIDGGRELSASMLATLVVNRVYEKLESDFLEEKKFYTKRKEFLQKSRGSKQDKERVDRGLKRLKQGLIDLREELNLISVLGICGSKADMQEDTGLNSLMYEEMMSRSIFEKTDCPFYGYSTKQVQKVWGQSTPGFNFMYSVAEQSELNKGFANSFKRLSANREKLIGILYDEFKWAFTEGKESVTLNTCYVESLGDRKISRLNEIVCELTGKEAVSVSYDSENNRCIDVNEGFYDSGFDHFSEDVIDMDSRISAAKGIVSMLGGNPEKRLSTQKPLQGKMKKKFRDNLIAFGDRDELEWSLEQLEKEQYVCQAEWGFLKGKSLSEVANCMTAMSKLGCGDVFMNAIDDMIYGNNDSPVIGEVEASWLNYKTHVFVAMKEMESRMADRKNLATYNNGAHFMDVSFLNTVLERIDARVLTGVCAGIAANTKLLPGGKGMFFTGVKVRDEIDGKMQECYKISGRATSGKTYEGVKINSLMERYGGGGHGSAAACKIPVGKLDDFLSDMGRFDFYRGELQ